MNLIGLLGLLPVLGWNAAHDWVGLRHVFAQAGAVEGPKVGFHWLRPVEFLAGQFAFLGGYWFCAWAAAAWVLRPWRTRDPDAAYLWWLSVPVVVVFLLAGLRTKAQANWPAAAYLSGFVLAVGWVARQLASDSRPYRRLAAACLAAGVGIGVTVSVVARYPATAVSIFASLAAPPSDAEPAPIRKLDPTARLRGWRALAAEVDRLRGEVEREEGRDPLITATAWTVPGELGFYCRGNPRVYSFGSALSDRLSQYDVWRPNPVADAQAFRGKTFVCVGEKVPGMAAMFDLIDPPRQLVYRENGVPVAGWTVWVGRGFRGFPNPPPVPRY
jgi:hypothetical protein